MEIVKRIARWVLRKELKLQDKAFETQAGIIHDYTIRYKNQESLIAGLRQKVFGSRKVLLSQTMVRCIVEMLPDPNKAGNGALTSSELKSRQRSFVDQLRGKQYAHNITFVRAVGEGEFQGLILSISDYNINVYIPLRRENIDYEIFGVSSAIETYFWDFYGSGIRMLSDEAFANCREFIKAQNNVLSDLREEGLL